MNDLTSKNVQNIEISGIRKFYNKVQKYPDAISLTLGQPDFNVPSGIKNAMIEAIEQNKTSYTSNAGIVELRDEISIYLKSMGIEYNCEEICLTIGGSEGLMDVFTALINKNDKVLIPTPAYPAYESCVKILGGQIINYSLKEDFSVDFDYLERIIKEEHPKIMVISYPCNPTGAILSREDGIKLHKIILDNDIIAVSDEMYAALCFDDKYYSIAQFGDLKSKVIIVGGFSKIFSMTGLRIGYVCAENKFMNEIMKVHQYNVSCAPSIVQWGAFYGLKNCMQDVEYMRNEFIKRRDYLYNRLKKMNFDVNLPMGAFYMFPSIKKFNIKSDKFCEMLLKEAKVAIVPGSAFGKGGEGYIRISYASNMDKLKSAADRIEKWI
ncbi:aminotransferase class I/II-fold pyridoxal phosphate-dependent enzyme [Clostridium tyrobutyricum]|uniref:pyridoxal phosphate-dependent aminotransferase n=1 Tax=Clostridium tyrobutyricum TaxID=1519 RepID=UPI001C382B2A|nr:aminotransferase class I/II-fold pyridoxal phosphate-dependent enzyme [Clostridium tyrobutyricum]MBV4419505.1 aminotransferase class I/II-fold pyridoxal phosphate-dependent enzyme [Clostridium tyrobutyricum]